ncbi:hypothetical protein LF1_27840 [Rubripirellula obstinata]|uniref:VWFA domain-containing protein n=1 Tax=Rubripirellula obstinata TaxID=406547 RepID=A0A5B1CK52_9BACT|nr:BatA domain-containing protein [Rubripirellula obstinata]KAA1260245.1 hypothetical protein LF1_27840 [Rubripirellula obstinata]
MTFLSSLFLFALPLIAVPLLLHFMRRRQRNTMHWGAMRFMQAAVNDRRRMRFPESLLLLLARCLFVAGLVFALARPMVLWGSSGGSSNRELIVIVDDSLSTARRFGGNPVFDQIRNAAQETISQSPKDLPFQLMLASGGGRWVGDQPRLAESLPGKSALAELANHHATLGTANLMGCVQKAISAAGDRETSTRPRPAQRIVVVTDGTTPAWLGSSPATLARLRSMIDESNLPVQIQVLEIESASSSFRNLSVIQLNSDNDRIGVKESVRMSAEIRNTGTVASDACQLAWQLDGEVAGHSSVTGLKPGQSTEVFWSAKLKTEGPVVVDGRLEQEKPDDLPEDSSATKIIEVVQQIPILFVDNQSPSATTDLQSQQIKFLTLALGYQGEEASGDYHSVFAPTIISATEVGSEDLAKYSAIIVVGTNNESPEFSDLLLPEVRRGCGVWVIISPDPDVDAFNSCWFQDGNGLSPLPLVDSPKEKSPDEAEVETTAIRIHPPSKQHPANRVLSDQQRIDLDQVTIKQHAMFRPLLLGDEVSIPLRSSNDVPLVVENSIGQGRVLFQAVPIAIETTNWPVTNSFVVTVHEWITYLSQPSATNLNLSAGSPLVWKFADRSSRPALLRFPNGTSIDLTEDPQSHGVDQPVGTFRFFETRLPGLYRAKASAMSSDPIEIPFYVQPAREELLAQPLLAETRSWLKDIGQFDLANSSKDLQEDAQTFWLQYSPSASSTGGFPIWQWILLSLVALLIFELLLAGRVSQRRSGVSNTAAKQLEWIQQSPGYR